MIDRRKMKALKVMEVRVVRSGDGVKAVLGFLVGLSLLEICSRPALAQAESTIQKAATFIVGTCYRTIDDISRIKSYAKLSHWREMPAEMLDLAKPVEGSDVAGWIAEFEGQTFLASEMPVQSFDTNRFTLDAAFGDYFDGERFRPHPIGGYHRCLDDSIKNINRLWESYNHPAARRKAALNNDFNNVLKNTLRRGVDHQMHELIGNIVDGIRQSVVVLYGEDLVKVQPGRKSCKPEMCGASECISLSTEPEPTEYECVIGQE